MKYGSTQLSDDQYKRLISARIIQAKKFETYINIGNKSFEIKSTIIITLIQTCNKKGKSNLIISVSHNQFRVALS